MKNRFIAALSACVIFAAQIAHAAPAVEPVTYSLIRNGTASGQPQGVTGGSYVLGIAGTFGGSTLGLSVTTNGITTEYDTWTSAPSDAPCFNIPTGSVVQATLTGGSPTGFTATLGGVGSGGCATASGGVASEVSIDQDTPGTTNGVVVNSSALPTGASTAAHQATLNTATGAPASTVCATSTGTCDLIAISKKIADWLEDVVGGQATAVPAGTNMIGKVGIDQTTPGTTNGVQVNAALPTGTNTIGATAGESATGAAVPAKASYAGAVSTGNLTGIIQADASVAINISTAATTQLVALTSAQKIYVMSYKVIAGGTGNFKFVYGTGSSCGTGTTDLEGNNNLIAQSGSTVGGGLGPVLVVPAGNALCATTSAAVQMSGHLAYTKF